MYKFYTCGFYKLSKVIGSTRTKGVAKRKITYFTSHHVNKHLVCLDKH